MTYNNNDESDTYNDYNDDLLYASNSGYKKPTVNWYPGHIAKAERQLAETLRVVDVIVEVRDGRACKATSHSRIGEWCAGRPRIVVLTHVDQIPKPSQREWQASYDQFGAHAWDAQVTAQVRNQAIQATMERQKYSPNNDSDDDRAVNDASAVVAAAKRSNDKNNNGAVSPVESVLFVNAKQGQGIHALQRAIFKAGAHVQERRERRGLKERPLRVGIIGYPNVGKSALINRILGRRRARTANTPGVTRTLQWIRVKQDKNTGSKGGGSNKKSSREFELLDSPGVIPASLENQYDAAILAACNCIGLKSYDNQAVAAFLCEWLKALHVMGKGHVTAPQWRDKCLERYGFDPMEPIDSSNDGRTLLRTGEDMLFQVADNTCRGDPEDASRKILQDFRAGRMGPVCLQLAPTSVTDDGQQRVRLDSQLPTEEQEQQRRQEALEKERQERAKSALETAKDRGLELPPIVLEESSNTGTSEKEAEGVVGKGMFDGW